MENIIQVTLIGYNYCSWCGEWIKNHDIVVIKNSKIYHKGCEDLAN